MIEPLPCRCMCGIAYLQQKKTLVVLTRMTRSQASIPVTRIESSSGGEMPALLKAMSTRPCRSATPSNSARTDSSSLTSQATNSPPTSSATALPASSEMSTAMTLAPSAANRRAVASPMPLPAPVITATRSCKRSTWCSLSAVGRDEDVLDVGEAEQRVGAQLTAQPGLLHATERGPVAHRRVTVDAEG